MTDDAKITSQTQTYSAPTLTVHGKVAELTAGGQSGSGEDDIDPVRADEFRRVHK